MSRAQLSAQAENCTMTSRIPEALREQGIYPRDQNWSAGKGQVMGDPTSSHPAQGSALDEVTEPQHRGQQKGFAQSSVPAAKHQPSLWTTALETLPVPAHETDQTQSRSH